MAKAKDKEKDKEKEPKAPASTTEGAAPAATPTATAEGGAPAAPPGEPAPKGEPSGGKAETIEAGGKGKKKPGVPPRRGKKLRNHLRNLEKKLLEAGPIPLKQAVA